MVKLGLILFCSIVLCLSAISLPIVSTVRVSFALQQGRPIHIRADGSIDPPTAAISTVDNITYTLTDNINNSITIERNNITLDGNNFVLNGAGSPLNGISVDSLSDVTIENMSIKDFTYCIWVDFSNNITIEGNTILILQYSPSVYPSGIHLYMATNCTVRDNQISVTNCFGIYSDHSLDNTITGNNITAVGDIMAFSGIDFEFSSLNLLQNNSLLGNLTYFYVGVNTIEDFVNSVDSSNSVGGKQVCYWINQQNKSVPTTAGYVMLVNCSNIIVEDLTMYQGGITLAHTHDSTITENDIRDSEIAGITLLGAYNNSILGNDLVGNYIGIDVSNFNSVNSSNNMIVGNNMTMNGYAGVYCYEATSRNTFFHNNFIHNVWFNVVLRNDAKEIWDNGFEGNYWSDYNGTDSNQDGIGDTPYIIDGNNTDHYPLMGTFQSFNVSAWNIRADLFEEVDVTSNLTINDAQLVGYFTTDRQYPWHLSLKAPVVNGSSYFCRVTFPNNMLNSSEYPVFIGQNQLSSRIIQSNGTYTTIYFLFNQTFLQYNIDIVPEFPFLLIPLFIIATLLSVVVYKRRETS
jgi:parallel beta-helix repeat protein